MVSYAPFDDTKIHKIDKMPNLRSAYIVFNGHQTAETLCNARRIPDTSILCWWKIIVLICIVWNVFACRWQWTFVQTIFSLLIGFQSIKSTFMQRMSWCRTPWSIWPIKKYNTFTKTSIFFEVFLDFLLTLFKCVSLGGCLTINTNRNDRLNAEYDLKFIE